MIKNYITLMYIFQNLLNLEKMAIHTVAIVIGVSQFENSKLETLPGARNDAILFANSLRNWGLEEKDIHLFLDLEASSETIVSCFEQLAALNEPFKLTFCYCGHGSRSLLPHPQSYLHLYDGKLSLDELLKSIYRLNAQENYLFIDACHLRINSLVNPELEREIQGKGDSRKSLFCLLSSGIEQSYEDIVDEYGYFTSSLVKNLNLICGADNNTPTFLLEKMGEELKKAGLPLPEMYNIETHRIDFFPIREHLKSNRSIKRAVTAIAACGMYLDEELFSDIFELDSRALTFIKQIGLVFSLKNAWIPHDRLYHIAESEEFSINPEKILEYWCHQIEDLQHEVQAAQSLILVSKCCGYRKERDRYFCKAIDILKSDPVFLNDAFELLYTNRIFSQSTRLLADIFKERGDHQKARLLLDIKRSRVARTILAASFLVLLTLFSIWLIPQQDRPFVFLPAPYVNFVGRENILEILERNLNGHVSNGTIPVSVLHGQGGIGKSETAIEFANRHLKDFSLIYWIDTRSPEVYQQSYYNLAVHFNLPISPKMSFEKIREKVNDALEHQTFKKPWLLIFDNADQYVQLPCRGNGGILITTRYKSVWKDYQCIEMPLLSKEAAEQLFAKVMQEKDEAREWIELAEDLNYFPLALDQVIHYVKESPHLSFSSYRTMLCEQKADILKYIPSHNRYSQNLYAMWQTSMSDLKSKHLHAYEWLQICAYLHPDKIPMRWVDAWLMQTKNLSSIDAQLKANEILLILSSQGFVKLNKEAQFFTVHRLRQKLLQQGSSPETVLSFLVNQVKHLQFHNHLEAEADIWRSLSIWEANASWFLNKNKTDLLNLENIVYLLHALGNSKTVIKRQFQEGLKLYQQAQNILDKIDPKKYSPSYIINLLNQADCLYSLGFYKESVALHQEALSACEKLYQNRPGALTVECLLSLVKMENKVLDNQHQALDDVEKVISILTLLNGHKTTGTLCESYKWLCAIWSSLGDYQKALAYGMEALEMNKCLLGDKPNIQRCHLLSYIGRIYSKAGDNDRALNYHLQVVQMYESIFLSEFSAPLHSFDLVAYDYRQKKDYKKALEYLNKALYLIEVLHDDHLNVTCLYTLAHAGGLYIDLNDMQKASYYYNKLLESCFTTLLNNENHILYGISYAGLGRICLKQAEAEKGIAYLEKALTIMQTHFPDDHSELLPLLIDLISPLQKIDSLKAKEYQQWTERIKEKNERVRSLLLSKK